MIQFLYGVGLEKRVQNREYSYTDITEKVVRFCLFNEKYVLIPNDDVIRSVVFGDPCQGIEKEIVLIRSEESSDLFTIQHFNIYQEIEIELNESELLYIKTMNLTTNTLKNWFRSEILNVYTKLKHIHSNLKFIGGSLNDEYPEQTMVVKYLNPNSKVLELGANIGRNTLIISTILKNDKNLVTFETDIKNVDILRKNRFINKYHFNIEHAALSKRRLIQRNGSWDSQPINDNENVPDGYFEINTISLDKVQEKYNMQFDTLVADCEGALYYILLDDPNFLKNFNLIILENDFKIKEHKEYVNHVFKTNNFTNIFTQALDNEGMKPVFKYTYDEFFQVWQRV